MNVLLGLLFIYLGATTDRLWPRSLFWALGASVAVAALFAAIGLGAVGSRLSTITAAGWLRLSVRMAAAIAAETVLLGFSLVAGRAIRFFWLRREKVDP
jgi:hypothetical protein